MAVREYQQAYDRWISLMGDTRADAPWAEVLQQRLTEASEKLGLDVAALPKPLPAAASRQLAPAPAQHPADLREWMSPPPKRCRPKTGRK